MPPPPSNSAPAPPVAPRGVSKVFLSSTVEDLEPLRNQVLDVALRKGQTFCWLSDVSGTNDYEPTEAYCKRELLDSHGYILVCAHFYGSVPPGQLQGRSITHLEFEWACERWFDQPGNHMTVLMPKPGSPVDLDLQKAAEAIVARRGLDAAAHRDLLHGFKTQITGVDTGWRKVATFATEHELREWALVACNRIREGLFMRMAEAPAAPAPLAPPAADRIGDAELGALGRAAQLASMLRAVATLNAGDHAALAVLVHGDKNAGHRLFLDHLFSEPHRAHLGEYRPLERNNQLPTAMAGLPALCAWIARSLRLPSGPDTAPSVAERCHLQLAQRSLGLLIDGIGSFPGGVAAFHAQFWQPFFDHLSALAAAQGGPHRLLVMLTTRAADSTSWATLARDTSEDAEPPSDGALLWPLPRLGPIRPEHVERWFNDMHVTRDKPRRAQLTQQLLNSEGESDPVPHNVIERLRGLLEAGEITFQQEP